MAAEAVTRRVIEVVVQASADANRQIKAIEKQMKGVEDQITKTQSVARNFAVAFGRAFVGALVAQQTIDGIRSLIDGIDKLGDESQQLGMSVSELTRWQHAVTMSGASSEDFAKGVVAISKAMDDLEGKSKGASFLRSAGVKETDSATEALLKFADAYKAMPNSPQKLAIVMDVLGKSGRALGPAMNEGAAGLKKFFDESDRVGSTVNEQTAKDAQEYGDNVQKIGEKGTAAGRALIAELLPALVAITGELAKSPSDNGFLGRLGQATGRTVVAVTNAARGTKDAFRGAGKEVENLYRAGKALADGNGDRALDRLTQAGSRFTRTMKESAKASEKLTDEVEDRYDPALRAQAIADAEAAKKAADEQAKAADAARKQREKDDVEKRAQAEKAKQFHEQNLARLKQQGDALERAGESYKTLSHAEQLEADVKAGRIVATTAAEKAELEENRRKAALADATEFLNKAQEEAKKVLDDSAQSAREHTDAIEKARTAYADMSDPLRETRRQLAELDAILADTKPSDERYAALMKTRDALVQQLLPAVSIVGDEMTDAEKSAKEFADTMKQGVTDAAMQTSDAIVDAFSGAKIEIDQIIRSILSGIAKVMLQRAIMRGLDAVFAPQSAVRSDSIMSVYGAKGLVVDRGGVTAFASGGIVSAPTMFAHGGGLGVMGEAGPEAIMPLKRSASGDLGVAASPLKVVINNMNGSAVKTEESSGPNGEQQLQIMIDRAVEEGLGRGRYDRVLSTSYGVSRRGR